MKNKNVLFSSKELFNNKQAILFLIFILQQYDVMKILKNTFVVNKFKEFEIFKGI